MLIHFCFVRENSYPKMLENKKKNIEKITEKYFWAQNDKNIFWRQRIQVALTYQYQNVFASERKRF